MMVSSRILINTMAGSVVVFLGAGLPMACTANSTVTVPAFSKVSVAANISPCLGGCFKSMNIT